MDKLTNSWKLIKIGSVIRKGRTLNPKQSPNKVFTYIDISSIDNNQYKIIEPKIITGKDAPSRARKKVQIDDIVFATTRPNLKNIAIVKQNYEYPVASTGFCVLSPKNDLIESKYLFWFLITNNLQEQIQPFIRGAQYPAISDSNIHSCLLPLPPLPEQKRIVTKLDALFERIDKSMALLEENIKHTESLMASALDEVFLEIKDSETKTFEEIKESNVIGLVKSVKQQSEEFQYPYFKMNNISNSGRLFLNKVVNVNATEKEVEKYSLRKDDFLFNTRNSKELVGKTCVYNTDKHMLFNNNIMRVRFKENINPYFIDYQFKSNGIKNKLESIKSGTTNVSAIYYKSLKSLGLLIPKKENQDKVVKYLSDLESKTDNLISEQNIKLNNLKALKESILDKAFKGEI